MPLPPLLLERLKRKTALSELGLGLSGQKSDMPTSSEEKRKKNSGAATEYSYQDTSGPSVVNSELVATNSGDGGDDLEEEIIAEDYSDDEGEAEIGNNTSTGIKHDNYTKTINCDKSTSYKGSRDEFDYVGCPNKYNIYHECSQYCVDNYGKPEALEPTLEQRKQLAIVLRTYPMSNEWTVVYDPGVRTFYFWNIIKNLVSWFPPAMEGFVSLSADQIRKSKREMELI